MAKCMGMRNQATISGTITKPPPKPSRPPQSPAMQPTKASGSSAGEGSLLSTAVADCWRGRTNRATSAYTSACTASKCQPESTLPTSAKPRPLARAARAITSAGCSGKRPWRQWAQLPAAVVGTMAKVLVASA